MTRASGGFSLALCATLSPSPVGKALLEKNEDLSKQNEKIAEEFSQKLEVGFEVPFCKLRAFPTILNRSPLCRTKEVGLAVFFGAGGKHQM